MINQLAKKSRGNFSTNEKQNQNQWYLVRSIFSTLWASFKWFLGALIGPSRCLLLLWFVGVTSLVLIFPFLFENRSIQTSMFGKQLQINKYRPWTKHYYFLLFTVNIYVYCAIQLIPECNIPRTPLLTISDWVSESIPPVSLASVTPLDVQGPSIFDTFHSALKTRFPVR